MTSRIFACAFAALALLVSNGAAARGRVVGASYYRAQDRQHLAAAVFLGTYGIDKDDAAAARSIPGGRYAPIVVPQAKEHPARNLPAADAAKIPKSLAKYAGAVPALKNLPRAERLAWGVEMGHRIRDGIRAAVRSGVRVDSFQLDEIWPTASDHSADGKAALQFLVGVLQGVHHGRTVLGDQPMTGLVHVAHPAKVAALPNDIKSRRP